MVQISKKKLPEEIVAKLFLLFFEIVGKKNKHQDFMTIINDLFSESERVMIIKRIAIIYLLLKNIDQRVIAQTIKVSPSTVSKFALISQESKGIVPFFKTIIKRKKIGEFLKDFYLTVISPPTKYGTDWKLGWKLEFERQRRQEQGI